MSAKKGSVVVSVVRPKEAARAGVAFPKSEVRSVRIVPEGTGKPMKLTRRSLERLLADAQGQANHLLELCRRHRIDERKGELMTITMQRNFWDDRIAARNVHTEIHRIDSIQAMVNGIDTDLSQLIYMNRDSSASAAVMEAMGLRAVKLQNRILMGKYVLHFQGSLERCQAFMDIRLIGHETLKIDPAGRIAGMYVGWAKSRDVPVRVLHEEVIDGVTRHVILLLESVAMTGLLAGEQGLHELHVAAQGRQRAASAFVDVKILPRLEESPRLPATRIVASKPQGKGKLARPYRSDIRVDCAEVGVKLQLRGELDLAYAKALAPEYLASEMLRRNNQEELPREQSAGAEEHPIRRYTLRPDASVQDYQTGVSHGGLAGIWQGHIDDMLQANLAQRIPNPDAASAAPSAQEIADPIAPVAPPG